MSSVRQIAREAGVSITTVSRVLNNHPRVSAAARQKVLAAANESRYIPPVGKRSHANIALLYTGESSLGSIFDASLMWGMSDGMEEHNYDLVVIDARRACLPGETYSQMFMRKGIRGAVVRTTLPTRSICVALAQEGFPAVVVGDRFDQPGIHCVYADSAEPSREAVEHLIALGHRRIALCLNVVDDADHNDRRRGYERALAENGLEIDRRLILRTPAHRPGGMQLMRRVASMADRPTALFITDPATAAGALKEARAMGVGVPEEMSIIGFDDGEMRFDMCPEMSAVCQDTAAIGRDAMSALHQLIEHGPSALQTHKPLRAWLEVHRSTAEPAAGQLPIGVGRASTTPQV